MKASKADLQTLKDIKSKFSEIELLFWNLPVEMKEEILDFHNENSTLNHCIRWGNIAVYEIIEEVEARLREHGGRL